MRGGNRKWLEALAGALSKEKRIHPFRSKVLNARQSSPECASRAYCSYRTRPRRTIDRIAITLGPSAAVPGSPIHIANAWLTSWTTFLLRLRRCMLKNLLNRSTKSRQFSRPLSLLSASNPPGAKSRENVVPGFATTFGRISLLWARRSARPRSWSRGQPWSTCSRGRGCRCRSTSGCRCCGCSSCCCWRRRSGGSSRRGWSWTWTSASPSQRINIGTATTGPDREGR